MGSSLNNVHDLIRRNARPNKETDNETTADGDSDEDPFEREQRKQKDDPKV